MTGGVPSASAPSAERARATVESDEVSAVLDVLDAAMAAALACAAGADGWDARTRQAAMVRVRRHLDAGAALNLRLVAAEREAGTWALHGDRDLAGFVGRTSHEGRGGGMAAVSQAATLSAMPAVADALADGRVTVRHVGQIARATQASPALAAELATSEGQAKVVEMARRLDGSEFGRALKQLGASVDPASRQREHDEQRANRFLSIAHAPGGTVLKGLLDGVAGHRLAKAIDALSPRPTRDDERSRAMRHADALMVMVDRVLTDERTTPDATAPVQAIVTFSERTWTAVRAGVATVAGREPGPGSAADVVGRLRGVPPVLDESGQAWPASEVARALCDCVLTRAVIGAPGRPLDLGRDKRLFGRAQWLALYAAGQRTCAVEGCGMPLAYTELHHMAWWHAHGGRTDLANCAPECAFHHGEIHRLDIRVSRRADGTYEHRHPDGRRYGGGAPPGTDSAGAGPPGRDLSGIESSGGEP